MNAIPGYLERLLDAIHAGHITPGEMTHVEVQHQPGCLQQPCTCHPCVTVLRETEVLVIGTDGHVLERRAKS